MDNLLEHLGVIALHNPEWTRTILGIGILIQGEIAILVAMYLILNGQIGFWEFVYASLLGLFIGEFFLYFLGRIIRGSRFGWKLARKIKSNRRIQLYRYYISQNMGRTLIMAKFLPAANSPTLLLLGWMRIRFGRFLRVYLPAVLLWFFGTVFIAFFVTSGLHYLKSSKVFERIEFIMAGIIILIFGGEWIIKKLLAKRAPKNLPTLEDIN